MKINKQCTCISTEGYSIKNNFFHNIYFFKSFFNYFFVCSHIGLTLQIDAQRKGLQNSTSFLFIKFSPLSIKLLTTAFKSEMGRKRKKNTQVAMVTTKSVTILPPIVTVIIAAATDSIPNCLFLFLYYTAANKM